MEGLTPTMAFQPSQVTADVQYFKPSSLSPLASVPGIYGPSPADVLNDLVFQTACLNSVKIILQSNSLDATWLRNALQDCAMKTMGLSVLPSPSTLTFMPFVHFDVNRKFSFTFIFESPQTIPWSPLVRNQFGPDYLNLQKELFELICYVPFRTNSRSSIASSSLTSLYNQRYSDLNNEHVNEHFVKGYRAQTTARNSIISVVNPVSSTASAIRNSPILARRISSSSEESLPYLSDDQTASLCKYSLNKMNHRGLMFLRSHRLTRRNRNLCLKLLLY